MSTITLVKLMEDKLHNLLSKIYTGMFGDECSEGQIERLTTFVIEKGLSENSMVENMEKVLSAEDINFFIKVHTEYEEKTKLLEQLMEVSMTEAMSSITTEEIIEAMGEE